MSMERRGGMTLTGRNTITRTKPDPLPLAHYKSHVE